MFVKLIHNRRKVDKGSPIEIYINNPGVKKSYISTRINILPDQWDSDNQCIRSIHPRANELNERLKVLVFMAKKEHNIVVDYARGVGENFNEYYENTLFNSIMLKSSSFADQRQTLNLLNKFQNGIPYIEINTGFIERFDKYMVALGYSPNTIGKHHKNIRKYILKGMREGKILTPNGISPYQGFKIHNYATGKKVRISPEEIEKLKDPYFDIYVNQGEIRDIFLIAYYTALRLSDVMALQPENLQTNQGKDFIYAPVQKTGQSVVIPAHPYILELVRKHKKFPKVDLSKTTMLKILREIFDRAGITEKIWIKKPSGESELVRKCDVVGFHDARRAGATNMLLSGIEAQRIMLITGHKTEESFMRYIDIDEIENAKELSETEFFTK